MQGLKRLYTYRYVVSGVGCAKTADGKGLLFFAKGQLLLSQRTTLALPKDYFSTPIGPPLQYKRASLTSKCYRLELKEALFVCFQDIRHLSKPI